MNARQAIIALGHELSEQDNKAFCLWTWLPSYKAAEAAHGDYAGNFTPSVGDILTEAALFVGHKLQPTPEQIAEAGDLYRCPCGEEHETAPQGTSASAPAPQDAALRDVMAERARQVAKGYAAEHDDEHSDCELARAAACYAVGSELHYRDVPIWPWGTFEQGQDYRRALVKAAALLLAEIERVDRRDGVPQA